MNYTFSHILYSHSDYNNVWQVWKHQTEKYLPNSNVYMFIDKFDIPFDYHYKKIFYDDTVKYSDRVLQCLNQMENDEEIVIYQHEDHFLYNYPNLDVLKNFSNYIKNDEIEIIRLIRVVDPLIPHPSYPFLFENPNNDKFSTQPTMLKVKTLKKIFSQSLNKNPWEFEINCGKTCLDFISYYCYNGEAKRGLIHYNSNIYPYIASAVVKGEWNMKEYYYELNNIFYEMGYK